jgi:hypothetical protein
VSASSKCRHVTSFSMTVIIGSWSFQWGNRAWLCLLHRPIASLQGANHSNLGPKFYGPFLVMECIGSVAYKLQLSRGAKFHDVFHFELLKKYHGPTPEGPGILPPIRHGRACLEPAEAAWLVDGKKCWCAGADSRQLMPHGYHSTNSA